MAISESQVYEALRKILADRKGYSTSLNYAVGYAEVGLDLRGHTLQIQCLYVLNNISHWRHSDAKEVRDVLRQFAKQSLV